MFTITLLSSKINMKSTILHSFVFSSLISIAHTSQIQASQTKQSLTRNDGYATFYEHDNAEEYLTKPLKATTKNQQPVPTKFKNELFDIDDVETDSGSCAMPCTEKNSSFNNSFTSRVSFTLSAENLTPDRPESTVPATTPDVSTPVGTTPTLKFYYHGVNRILSAYKRRTEQQR